MSEMDRFIGKILSEKYEITEIIGIGGMSVVYKAKDLYNGRIVAIKLLKDEFNTEMFKNRFINESRVISMLSHKNVVDVLDVHISDDVQYIVMEYVDGITLKQYMSKRGKLEWREAVYFTEQILKGLQHAHEKGIIHRDIKPHNIMLLPDGTIKVADFGIARFQRFDTATLAGDKAIGTVHYISPEQASKNKVDAKSDIYSLGITLYEMVTGVLPFEGDSPVNIALKQIQERPKPPREINPNIPKGLEEIIMKAICKRPDNRYGSADEMCEAINKIRENPVTVFNYKFMNDSLDAADKQRMKELKKQKANKNFFKRHNMLFSIPVAIGIVLGIAFSSFVWYMVNDIVNSASEGYVEVPNLVGKKYEDIISSSEYADLFTFTQKEAYSNVYEKGIVTDQSLTRNTKVLKGSKIELTVSIGIKTGTIPEVVGKDIDSVAKILQNMGFIVKTEYQYSDVYAEKKIISCTPGENTNVAYGTEITLVVSRGRQVQLVKVPNVLGKDESEAIEIISNSGFVVLVEYEYSSVVKTNSVISQSSAPNTRVAKGTVITLVVSEGPEPVQPPEPEVNSSDVTSEAGGTETVNENSAEG
ncbi:MAG: Stk1 family PASTA domain-containing Ser/Thr kinase [Clostridia bacterium]|nr:Stk1 family PASTA domain-containing Ser/Thr kinase [Clostridia bacterium]MBR2327826.1 Stk1 family PASTA domain-containing Ser/Thr kinase [Clostridia bacterium]